MLSTYDFHGENGQWRNVYSQVQISCNILQIDEKKRISRVRELNFNFANYTGMMEPYLFVVWRQLGQFARWRHPNHAGNLFVSTKRRCSSLHKGRKLNVVTGHSDLPCCLEGTGTFLLALSKSECGAERSCCFLHVFNKMGNVLNKTEDQRPTSFGPNVFFYWNLRKENKNAMQYAL